MFQVTDATRPRDKEEVNVGLIRQYLISLNVDVDQVSLNAPKGEEEAPEVKVNIYADAVDIDVKQGIHETVLTVEIIADGGNRVDEKGKNIPLFSLFLTYGGLFKPTNIPESEISEFLLVFCASMLFPFVRSIVSQATLDAGLPALMLDMVDFMQMYSNRQNQ